MHATLPTKVTRKQARTVNVSKCVSGHYAMRITANGKTCGYWLCPLKTDWGQGWKLDKFLNDSGTAADERSYNVRIEEGGESICSCRGHERSRHCRHVEAISALAKAGRIG